MSERGERNVVRQIDGQRLSERLGSVLLALVGELLNLRTEIYVEDSVETIFPHGSEGLLLDHALEVAQQRSVEFIEIMLLGAVVQTAIYLLGNDTELLDSVHHVVGCTALSEVELAVQTNEFLGLLLVAVANDPDLRQIDHLATILQNLALEESQTREAPAGATAALILNRGSLYTILIGDFVAFGHRNVALARLCLCAECQRSKHCSKNKFFHSVLVFLYC